MTQALKRLSILFFFFSFLICPTLKAENSTEGKSLILYYSPYCPHCMKVLNYLHEVHKTVPMRNVSDDKTAKEELIKIGGKGQVPCLIIDGYALYESNSIIEWMKTHQEELPDES